jgi:hypothetical protein
MYGTILRWFKTKRDYVRRHGDGRIVELDCPTQWTDAELERINESPDVVGIALTCDRTTTANPDRLRRCVRAHVLAIVWKRSGIVHGDAAECARLAALLTPVDDAPGRVHQERLHHGSDVSLLWHVDPIEPPERIPFGAPEIAR